MKILVSTTLAVVTLAALPALGAAPGSAGQQPEASCPPKAHRCHAQRWERKAAEAASPQERAQFLHAAAFSYGADFKEKGGSRSLCAARRLLERSIAIRSQPPEQRRAFEGARAELEALEGAKGIECGKRSSAGAKRAAEPSPKLTKRPAEGAERPPPEPPPLMALGTDTSPMGEGAGPPSEARSGARETVTPVTPITSDSPDDGTPERAEGAVMATEERERVSPPAGPIPPPTGPGLSDDAASPGLPWWIAGGGFFGLGLALTGVASDAALRRGEISRAGLQWVGGFGELKEPPGESTLEVDTVRRTEYRRWTSLMVGTAVAAGASAVIGGALVAVGVRRHRQGQRSLSLIPSPGGAFLLLRGRF